MSIRTYKYKLYRTKRVKHLHDVVNISGIIYNHCIALHKRYYKLYGKSLNKFQLQKHLTKLKKRDKYAFWNKVPSQAIQNITERIDNAYKKFFDYAKGRTKLRTSPPSFKAVKKYKSYTLKGKVGYKIDKNSISLNGYTYKFWLSRPIDGIIKTVIIKRDTIGDFYICITFVNGGAVDTPELYYATFFHELAHSTGHTSRLNRDFSGNTMGGQKALKAYAKEELIAETTRAFLQVHFGLNTTDMEEQNAAYLKGWLKPLKEDPKMLWKIFSDASKAFNFLIQFTKSEEAAA